jgi:mannan endo-1,4-beta-mannosidase
MVFHPNQLKTLSSVGFKCLSALAVGKFLFLFLAIAFSCSAAKKSENDFVKVNGTRFEMHGKPYYFVGANFWYGLNLASKGAGGDRERLIRELDKLKSMGITNLRIMAASEGPDTEPWRMVPALQKAPGVYNEEVLDGLDFLLYEMGKRGMYAVVCLNNFWPWSGGMAQYVRWHSKEAIPYPPPQPGGNWDTYQKYTARFYSNKAATESFKQFLKFIINRVNNYSNIAYKDDPIIMAWELTNEPRGVDSVEAFNRWIDETASYIKLLDKNHLVTTGSEGETPYKSAGNDFIKNHDGKNIDYATVHIWIQNWGWYDPLKPDSTYDVARKKMIQYFNEHINKAKQLNKPLVLEEFGIARDSESFAPSSPTKYRDIYYQAVFEKVYQSIENKTPVNGLNFWAWAGEGRPKKPYGSIWQVGDNFIGDPPHEHQGWYSVYDKDSSTLDVIINYATKVNTLNK